MFKVLIFFSFLLGLSFAAVETNKRGGHGIFHGLENEAGGKSSWLEEPKNDSVKISKGNTNSLLSNTELSSQKSSLYLQPEPRGLEYLSNGPDENPFLSTFFRKKRGISKNINKQRRVRQINLQPGNVIPGSMGQAVLYGFPNSAVPTNGYEQQPVTSQQQIQFRQFPQGYPSRLNQNTGSLPSGSFPNSQDQTRHVGGYKTYGY